MYLSLVEQLSGFSLFSMAALLVVRFRFPRLAPSLPTPCLAVCIASPVGLLVLAFFPKGAARLSLFPICCSTIGSNLPCSLDPRPFPFSSPVLPTGLVSALAFVFVCFSWPSSSYSLCPGCSLRLLRAYGSVLPLCTSFFAVPGFLLISRSWRRGICIRGVLSVLSWLIGSGPEC